MSFVWQLSGHRNVIKLKLSQKAQLCFQESSIMRTSDIPALHFFLSLLSCCMKWSRPILFMSSELGKWSGSLLCEGRERERERERAGQNHNTSLWWCGYTGKHMLERMDGPPKCCAQTLPSAFWTHSAKVCECVGFYTTRQCLEL